MFDFLNDIQIYNEDNLIFIAFPYDLILYNKEYFWFNNLSEKQFIEADTNISIIVSREMYNIK